MRKGLWVFVALLGLAGGRLTAFARAEGGKPPLPPGEEEGEGRGPGGDAFQPPSEAEEREVFDFIKQNNPEMAKHLAEAKEHNPDGFHHKFRDIVQMYRNPEMRQSFVQNMKAEEKVRQLMHAYRKADGKEKQSLRADLEQALGEQFDAKLAGHEMHLKKMQEEISRQKERIAKRKALREQIVKKRLAEISGDVESWEW